MGRKSKYPLLDDIEWLRQKYVIEELSTVQIGLIAGSASPNSVAFRLKKFGIPMRNMSECRTFKNRTTFIFDKEVIEGSLLGDASLRVGNKQSKTCVPSFRKTNVGYDHVLYVADFLCGHDAKNKIKEWWYDGKRYFSFATKHSSELTPVFRRWYPEHNGFEKLVPRDLDLTPKVLLHWFMDDGTTSLRNRKTRQVRMTFCSESFTKDDNEWLCEEIWKRYGVKAGIVSNGGKGFGWRIFIPAREIDDMYQAMGECPVPSMRYKWK